ncbi:hypothetical protein AAFC00_000934 [Neodothiora populina]|uniref:FAD/NAD(P)-binding domain-containing protein n=2 Tax=Neodothiora populina TaxID=2781224 RepID=A0ABR3PM74_9PEZI
MVNNVYATANSSAADPNVYDTSERDGAYIPQTDESGYRIEEHPYGTKRQIKVILMGAGASTLNFLKKAEDKLQNVDITVYEKNDDVGGTWLENRYPGCACDVPAVNYQFSWKIQPWSRFYAYAPEIWRYLKDIEVENDFIREYIKLRHKVKRAEWDSDAGVWRLQIEDLVTGKTLEDSAEFFINAGGVLNNWKWPDIPGLKDFKGKLLHSAAYEEGYPLDGKRVAVIGAGSSGVQIVSNIHGRVKHCFHWCRSPIWVTPSFGGRWAGKDGSNFECNKEQIALLRDDPKTYLEYRKQIENELNQRFGFIMKGSDEANEARRVASDDMKRHLKDDPRLVDKIIPKNFNVGCRRPTPAPGYLQALTAPNMTVFTDPIDSITATGFTDHTGAAHDVDVIICATGFDTSWLPRYPFIAHGHDLRDVWSQDVTSYLSIAIPSFPNHFTFCGPYGPLGHGSFMPLIECWTSYMQAVITKAQIEGIKSLAPRADVSRQFRQHADLFLQRTAWTSPCRSWFKQGRTHGQVAMYPGSRVHHLELLKAPRYEDFEIEYWNQGNRFAFLGNGFEVREGDGRDITHYLGSLGGDDRQPEYDAGLIYRLAGWTLDSSSSSSSPAATGEKQERSS